MQQSDRTVYVGNVGKEVDESALLALFGHCGTVTQIRIAGEPSYDTRYAFIEFSTPEESQTALLLDGMNVFERPIKVNMARGGSGPGIVRSNDPDRVQRTIHVGGLPFEEITEETLAEYFSHVGEVNAVRKSGRFAWVEFATLMAAQTAMSLDGESLGNGIMKVSTSKTPIHTAGWRAQKFRDQPAAAPVPAPRLQVDAPPPLPAYGQQPLPPQSLDMGGMPPLMQQNMHQGPPGPPPQMQQRGQYAGPPPPAGPAYGPPFPRPGPPPGPPPPSYGQHPSAGPMQGGYGSQPPAPYPGAYGGPPQHPPRPYQGPPPPYYDRGPPQGPPQGHPQGPYPY